MLNLSISFILNCSEFPNSYLFKNKKTLKIKALLLAASPGLEPRLTESESAVLPLDDEAIIFKQRAIIKTIFFTCQILLQKILHFYKIYATLQNRRKNYG